MTDPCDDGRPCSGTGCSHEQAADELTALAEGIRLYSGAPYGSAGCRCRKVDGFTGLHNWHWEESPDCPHHASPRRTLDEVKTDRPWVDLSTPGCQQQDCCDDPWGVTQPASDEEAWTLSCRYVGERGWAPHYNLRRRPLVADPIRQAEQTTEYGDDECSSANRRPTSIFRRLYQALLRRA